MEERSLWALGPLVGTLIAALASMVVFALRCALRGRPRSARIEARGPSALLGTWLMEWYYWATEPAIRFLARAGVAPNAVTAVSLAFAALAGAFFWAGHYASAGWVYLISGTLDILDGRLARKTGRASPEGAFFDSTLDRYAELFVYLGLLVNLRFSPALLLAAAALAGSLMTSYARARGEALGVDAPQGGMQRAERVVYLGLAAVFSPVADLLAAQGGRVVVSSALCLIAISSNWTAVRRAVHVFRTLRKSQRPAAQKSL